MNDIVKDPFARLKAATPARVGLGRVGTALPTQVNLDFQYAHSRARDAVHAPLDQNKLIDALDNYELLMVQSAAPDRTTYLRRPDLGRQLRKDEAERLAIKADHYDICFVIADGLSSDAVQNHSAKLIKATLPFLKNFKLSPIVLATQGRVAIGDKIAMALGARLVVILIGERPGLTVADSLGVYITINPNETTRDSERNCISNIHQKGGLSYEQAAHKISWLIHQALSLGITGTQLKEDADHTLLENDDIAKLT